MKYARRFHLWEFCAGRVPESGCSATRSSQRPKPPESVATLRPNTSKRSSGACIVSGETPVVRDEQPRRPASRLVDRDQDRHAAPRDAASVSIIDRRTLDDMGAISVTQAHD